ncbi:MAG TPA: hypothetical protein VFZ53_17440 [Polyangiaceae bacterium]
MDLLLVALPSLAFAALVTAHVRLLAGLAAHPPRLRALWALVCPPLAPFWAYRENLRGWAVTWGVSLVAYALALLLASSV